MPKGKTRIKFHKKIMNTFQAKLYVCGLKYGLVKPKLDDEETEKYFELRYKEERRKEAAQRLLEEKDIKKIKIKEPRKKDYLIGLLERTIFDAETLQKPEYCKKYGHIEEKGYAYTPKGIEGAVTHYICINCGNVYEKRPSEKIINPFAK
jgi:hypothetical protein